MPTIPGNKSMFHFTNNKATLLRYYCYVAMCLQCFDTVGWAAGKGIRPVKNWVVGCWRGCLGRGADVAYSPADATATHCLLLQ